MHTRCHAIAGITARCRCTFRYTSNFTTASRSFSATARLSCIVLHQRLFSNAEITHSTLISTAVTCDTAIAENHGTRPVKATMIVNMWLFYCAKKCYNKWSQPCTFTNFGCKALDQLRDSQSHKCRPT